jgi:signal peptidase
MTIASDGTIYASDPHWKQHDGQIWRIRKSAAGEVVGERMTADRQMSTTNGIDLSPDGKTLYVGESDTRQIWSYRIDGARLLAPRLFKRFDDFDIDGLRTDVEGNLLVARILKGTVVVLSPQGEIEAGGSAQRKGTDEPRLRRHGWKDGFRDTATGRVRRIVSHRPSGPRGLLAGVSGGKVGS